MPEPETTDLLPGWLLVEQLGHKRLAGYVSEMTVAGVGMLRVDVPGDPPVTQLIHPSTLYALTPIDEALARQLAVRFRPQPVSRFDLPQLTPPRTVEAAGYSVADEDEDDHGYNQEDDDEEDDDDRPL